MNTNIAVLEDKYLKAKIAYYEGDPFLTDAEFDILEEELRKAGSKVIDQVGSKRKDFDFAHPSKMQSLAKIQTEIREEDGSTDYKVEPFMKWFNKNTTIIKSFSKLIASPKFDGSAINIIYKGNKLFNILTRGDGKAGKSILKRLKEKLPEEIDTGVLKIDDNDFIEIRCEVVIDTNIFNEKYKGSREEGKFANARNYVAGVLGKDDYDEVKVSELTIIPLAFLVNGKHIDQKFFSKNKLYHNNYNSIVLAENLVDTLQGYEKLREEIQYQLDGVVFAFPHEYRETLGENEHDPEWAIAIKFIPKDTITEVVGIEWNVSKRGELCPVMLLKPVELDGTIVKRASGYNAGYVDKNKLGVGAKVSIAKAGDIIPEIQKVIVPSEDYVLPETCPECGGYVEYDMIHLECENETCPGKIKKLLGSGAALLDLKGVGGKRLEAFANDFKNIFEVFVWVQQEGYTKQIEKYGFKYGERLHEIFFKAFKNIKELNYETVIQMLGYENVGKKLSIQIAKEHAGLTPDYTGLEKALVEKLHTPAVENQIKNAVDTLRLLEIKIITPGVKKKNSNVFGICMTGSPKAFGYKNKAEFISQFPGLFETSLSDSECKYLITDSYDSTSGKMKTAVKKGIEIKTYEDFKV